MRGNIDTMTGEQFLEELFEHEYCGECGGDVEDHDAVPLDLGAYGANWFARCKPDAVDHRGAVR